MMVAGGPLIGREAELAVVDAFLSEAAEAPTGLVFSGEPGIGKTALLEAAIARASARGAGVLVHRSVQAEAEFAFAGLADLVGPVLDEVAEDLPKPRRRALEIALLLE